MRLFILLIVVVIILVIKKYSVAGLIDLVKKAFSNLDSNVIQKRDINSSIPSNIRRDIINQQYLFMYQDKQSPFEDNKEDEMQVDAGREVDNEDHNVADLNVDSVLVDKNGEIHSLYDLSSATVDQKESSQRTFSFNHENSQHKTYQRPKYEKKIQSASPNRSKQAEDRKNFTKSKAKQEAPVKFQKQSQELQADHSYIDQVRARLKTISKQN